MKRAPNHNPATPSLDCDLSALKAKAGALQKLNAALSTSRAAGEALIQVREEQIRAEANVAITAINLGEASLRAGMVGGAMAQIGALTTRVNTATASVDQALTNGMMAEMVTHIANRAGNLRLVDELLKGGQLGPDEAEALAGVARMAAVGDINASQRRMEDAKKAVAALSEFALAGIEASKNRLLGG